MIAPIGYCSAWAAAVPAVPSATPPAKAAAITSRRAEAGGCSVRRVRLRPRSVSPSSATASDRRLCRRRPARRRTSLGSRRMAVNDSTRCDRASAPEAEVSDARAGERQLRVADGNASGSAPGWRCRPSWCARGPSALRRALLPTPCPPSSGWPRSGALGPGTIELAVVVARMSAVGEQYGDYFGHVHAAAPTETDDCVDLDTGGLLHTFEDAGNRGARAPYGRSR